MKKHWLKMAICGLPLVILVSMWALDDSSRQTYQAQRCATEVKNFIVALCTDVVTPFKHTAGPDIPSTNRASTTNAKVQADVGAGILRGEYAASISSARKLTAIVLANLISEVWASPIPTASWPDSNAELNALDYAKGTPSLSGLQAAVRSIGVRNHTLRLPVGTWPITDDFTVPVNITLKPERGAILSIATGKTLTINGAYEAGPHQTFSCLGTGKVVFGIGAVANSYPEWWGACSDGSNAVATYAAIQAAINAGHGLVYLSANGNYNIGTTGLTFVYGNTLSMQMAFGSRITYTGTEAAITIDTTHSPMNGLRLDLFDIYSSGKYAIKFSGGTSGGIWDHYCQSFSIKVNEIYNITEAAIYVDCVLEGGDMDIMLIHTPSPYTAWGVYFTPGITKTSWEDVRIKYIHAGTRAAYLPANWNYGRLDVDVDSNDPDNTYNKIELAGKYNQIIIRASAPGSLDYTFNRPIWLKPGAYGNTLIASPYTLKGIVDDTPVGDNTYGGMLGTDDLLLNGSFQSFNNNSPVDWTNGNCTTARETTEFRFGKCGVKIIAEGRYACIYQPIPHYLIGKTVTLSGWFKAPSTNSKEAGISLAGGAASGMSNVVIPKDNSWHFLSATGVVPNPPNNIYIYANITDRDGKGDIVYAGGCSLIVGSSPVFPDSNPGTHLYSKSTWKPINIADGAVTSTKVSCVGAGVGDPVMVGFSQAVPAGAMLSGSVTAPDMVAVTLFNKTGAPLDLASGTLKVVVRKN